LRYLLDTNAVSEPRRLPPDRGYLDWIAARDPADLAISALTFGELKRGVAALPLGRRRAELEAWLTEGLSSFADRILPVDLSVASAWAEVSALHKRLGRAVGVIDELIAATALAHGLIVVTRNFRDFEASGCELQVPWSSGT
jgi:predicted nucleic acid-binding protein